MSNPNIAFLRGQDGALVLGGILDGSPVVQVVGAQDAMTDINGTNLEAHTPVGSGFTSWAEGTVGGITIQSNKAQGATSVLGGADGVLSSPALVNDKFSYWADIKPNGTGSLPGLRFRSDTTLATGTSAFVLARISANPETSVTFTVIRWGSGSAQETFIPASGINLGALFTNGIRLGVTVTGSNVQVWTEPYGGGTRTNRGTAVTLATPLNDGSHRSFGLVRTSNGDIGTTWDNVMVVTGAASGASSISLAGGVGTTLYGIANTGDTFTIPTETGTPTHTVTGGPYLVVNGVLTGMTFSTVLASDVAPGSTVTFTTNSVAQARLWRLRASQALVESTVFGNKSRARIPLLTTFQGMGEAYLDYSDPMQKRVIDKIVSASPATLADLALVFQVGPRHRFYGAGLASNIEITGTHQTLYVVSFTFESSGDFGIDWTP